MHRTTKRVRKRTGGEWVRDASDELAIKAGCTFDPESAAYVNDFLRRFCRLSRTKGGPGAPLDPLPWQKDLIDRLFGWKRPDGTRRFRTAYLEAPKKSGKSPLLSGLSLELLLADGEVRPDIYLNAVDREQAGIIYGEAERMVRASPSFLRRLEVTPSRKLIFDHRSGGKILANSADVPSKDGVDAHGVIFDELHRQGTRYDLWHVMEFASVARTQPLRISITTAGDELAGPWFDQRAYSENVRDGLVEDWSHLGIVYRVEDDEDFEDPRVWSRVNPGWGITIDPDDFARDFAKARSNPEQFANFLRLRLNLVVSAARRFLSLDAWRKCNATPEIEDGADCYLGLDLSSRIDLTSLAAIFPRRDDDGLRGVDLVADHWLPEDGLSDRSKKDAASYEAWRASGHLRTCPGTEVDTGAVFARVREYRDRYNVRAIGYDPWNALALAQRIRDELDVPIVEVRQGTQSLNHPTKELERLATGGKIRHGGNPLLAWCVSNAVAVKDSNGNIKLDKRKSRGRIDGAAATVNALAAYDFTPPPAVSVYETRGVYTIGA